MEQLAAKPGDEDVDPLWSPAARRRRAGKAKGNGDAAPHHGWRAKAFEGAPLASSPGHVQQFPMGASGKEIDAVRLTAARGKQPVRRH